MKQIVIRNFEERDLGRIEEILKVIGWADQYVVGQLECIKKLCISNSGEVFVAIYEEVVVGFIQVEHHQWNRLSYLHGLVVHPDFRRSGIAKNLVERVALSSKIRQQRGISVDTPVDNLGGRKFYTSIGFNEAYIMPEFYETGLDGVTFQKFFDKHPTNGVDLSQIQLEGEKLLCKTVCMEYAEDICKNFTAKVTKWMWPSAPKTQAQINQHILEQQEAMSKGEELALLVLKKETQEFLGYIAIHALNTATPEMGIWLKEEAHGQGYGFEALSLLKNWANENLSFDYLKYPVEKNNIASQALSEKLGGKVEAEYIKKSEDGRILDEVEYRLYKFRSQISIESHLKWEIFKSSEKDIQCVNEKLTKFNNQHAPFTQSSVDIFFNYHVKDSNGDIIAGINSIMYAWGIVFIGILFVDEAHRAKGLGIKLLKHVENEAKKNGGYLALLDTFDFQAKDFYIKAGYEVFGTVHDCPPGHTRYHMLKRLNSPELKPFAPLTIETERLRLIAATRDLSTAAITDIALFSKLLNARITDEWPPELLSDAQGYFSEMLTQNPSSTGWWIWYVILKAGCDVLIGNLCFKGPPSDQGKVEIGYAILPEFEKNGFATEAVRALISWAFSNQQVTSISAETFPNLPVSIKVMEKIGMSFAGNGSEEGTIRYEIRKKEL